MAFLRGEIEGRAIDGAVALPRAYLRDGDRVWVMNDENRLEIRAVEVAWRGPEDVLVSDGLAAGDRVVKTHLTTVAEGMALRTGDRSGAEEGAAVADRTAEAPSGG